MKVIYMQQTLHLMSNGRAKETEILISSGQVKQTQDGINYLLTIIDDGNSIVQQEI
ncbi:hypothetical protein UFOVP54_122 [uncultured Caudovirales phage]|uniref:Uncharacterized protein n=1 Tax=uncultured Caudovirales phage TaxID=2100421 RepID=A0A6J5KZ30_9CAUD|nr:hypothetical protein UFOVP54_122 [uncultured Caudovirales phage]